MHAVRPRRGSTAASPSEAPAACCHARRRNGARAYKNRGQRGWTPAAPPPSGSHRTAAPAPAAAATWRWTTRPGIQRHHIRSPAARPGGQLPDEHPDLSSSRGHRVDAVPLADLQVLSQAAGIRVDRPRRTAKIGPDPQPLSRALMPGQSRPLLLNPRPHAHPDPRPVSSSRRHYPAMNSTRRRHAAQIPRN